MEINSANLKRWIEETNIEMLEGVVLEGQGDRLRQKASTVLKDFDNNDSQSYIEETVPAMMSRIQNIHAAVSIGDLSCLQEGIEKKKDYILSKDHQGMTPLHKATIMGHVDVVQYILEKFPETVNARDREGRSALHYSTATTNRNGNKIYKMLVRAGADPRVRDVVSVLTCASSLAPRSSSLGCDCLLRATLYVTVRLARLARLVTSVNWSYP